MMMHFGRQISRLGRTFLSPQKVTPLSSRLSYQFACTSFHIQKRSFPYQKSPIPSLKVLLLTSPRRKDNGSSMTKPLQMLRPIKSLSRSKVQLLESSPNYMLLQVIPYLSESLSLVLMLMQKNLKEHHNLPVKKKNPSLPSHLVQHQHNLNRHPRKMPPKRLPKQINPSQLLLHHHLQFSLERGSRLVSQCQG